MRIPPSVSAGLASLVNNVAQTGVRKTAAHVATSLATSPGGEQVAAMARNIGRASFNYMLQRSLGAGAGAGGSIRSSIGQSFLTPRQHQSITTAWSQARTELRAARQTVRAEIRAALGKYQAGSTDARTAGPHAGTKVDNTAGQPPQPDALYTALGVPHDATPKDIRKAYRDLALKLHPDRNRDNPDATAQFQAIQKAYELLSDPETKRLYDTGAIDEQGIPKGRA